MYADQSMEKLATNLKHYMNKSLSYKVDTQSAYLNDIIGHSERVTRISILIGQTLGLVDEQLKLLYQAAIYHDIGKAAVPFGILFKREPLNVYELCIIKAHATIGANFLQKKGYPQEVADAARYHHEKFNGTGYPIGRSGEDISIYARIISIADAYDAITSPRVYKEAKDVSFAVEEIERYKGTQFDPWLADLFLQGINVAEK